MPAETSAARIADAAGNAAIGFTNEAVTNGTPAAENTAPTGLPVITGTAQVGETLTASVTEIEAADGLTGAAFAYQWRSDDGDGDADIAGAMGTSYTLANADVGRTITVRVDFSDDAGTAETLTSAATAAVAAVPLTASFEDVPAEHDGSTAFTFRLRFSEDPAVSYKVLRDQAFSVSGGTVKKARRVNGREDLREIHVQPETTGEIRIDLPATTRTTRARRP